MLMAIIEYEVNDGVDAEFRSTLGGLLPRVATIDGFLGAYPASSLTQPGRLYEISYWRDATALAAWSNDALHRQAKAEGRARLLKWYRIRVGEVARDWSFGEVPLDLKASFATS